MTGKVRNIIGLWAFGIFAAIFFGAVQPSMAQDTQLKQAIAQAAASDKVLAAYYSAAGYQPLWTGKGRDDRARRRALLDAFEGAPSHGLPANRYDAATVEDMLKNARSASERGRVDVELSRMFLAYASDVSTGILVPNRVDEEINRRPLRIDQLSVLKGVGAGNPARFMARLAPKSPEYRRLMAAKIEMEKVAARDAWGPQVAADRLEPGDSGPAVVALRNRLIRMGFMSRSVSATYDQKLTEAVRAFQSAHGLATDGITGPGTLSMLNESPQTRLAQIIVALERERWMNFDLGKRHVEVNIPDYTAKIIDDGKVTFQTRAVVGQALDDHRTPEFSDEMEYMVVNPSWYVPRDIATAEYLPMLQEDPFAVSHLDLLDPDGNLVDRQRVDFTSITEDTWPFLLKEPPSQGNALGLVKFMLPNKYNIYLHDTPQKSLFGRETRAFSHGCIRLADPFGFAYAILARQTPDPEGFMRRALQQSEEYHVNLQSHIPVHLIYQTARVNARGQLEFRRDVYRRDAEIFSALRNAGVTLMTGNS